VEYDATAIPHFESFCGAGFSTGRVGTGKADISYIVGLKAAHGADAKRASFY
jgi:hypothetical protein